MKKDSVMIAWVGYQRRAEAMKDYWGYDVVYFPKVIRHRRLLALDYLIRTIQTIVFLVSRRPSTIWIQSPPSFLLYIGALYSSISGRGCSAVADIHNSFLRKKWLRFPFLSSCVRTFDAVVVHNERVSAEYSEYFPESRNLYVLEDRAIDVPDELPRISLRTDSVLFPCSFDEDEPIEIVFRAAKALPRIDFFITGKYRGRLPEELVREKPGNVHLLGYLSVKEFDSLLSSCTAVLGLTTRSNVQLSVANEAISFRKAMVLSDTPTLRDLFDGARFVDTLDSASIACGVEEVLSNREFYEAAASAGLKRKMDRWSVQAAHLKETLDG